MPLPDERKRNDVSSLIQMFKEKERQEQSDPEKLKPRSSLEPQPIKPLRPSQTSSPPRATASAPADQQSQPEPSADVASPPVVHTQLDAYSQAQPGAKAALAPVKPTDLTDRTASSSPADITEPSVIERSEPSVSVDTQRDSHSRPPEAEAASPAPLSPKPKVTSAAAAPSKSSIPPSETTIMDAQRTPAMTPSTSTTLTSASMSTSSAQAPAAAAPKQAQVVKSPPRRVGFMAPTASSAARAAANSPARKSLDTPRKAATASTRPKAGGSQPPSSATSPLGTKANLPGVAQRAQQVVSPTPSPGRPSRARCISRPSPAVSATTAVQGRRTSTSRDAGARARASAASAQPQRIRKASYRAGDASAVKALQPSQGVTSLALPTKLRDDNSSDAQAASAFESRREDEAVDRSSQTGEAEPSESGRSVSAYGSMTASTGGGTDTSCATSASGDSETDKHDPEADMAALGNGEVAAQSQIDLLAENGASTPLLGQVHGVEA
ncbi:hypothetical protein ACQY0O_006836 [Thecaphora frezii]